MYNNILYGLICHLLRFLMSMWVKSHLFIFVVVAVKVPWWFDYTASTSTRASVVYPASLGISYTIWNALYWLLNKRIKLFQYYIVHTILIVLDNSADFSWYLEQYLVFMGNICNILGNLRMIFGWIVRSRTLQIILEKFQSSLDSQSSCSLGWFSALSRFISAACAPTRSINTSSI